jgi:hypothetical protein
MVTVHPSKSSHAIGSAQGGRSRPLTFHTTQPKELPELSDRGIWARLIAASAYGLRNGVRTFPPLFSQYWALTNSSVRRHFLLSDTLSHLCINSGIVACSSTCRVTPPRIN